MGTIILIFTLSFVIALILILTPMIHDAMLNAKIRRDTMTFNYANGQNNSDNIIQTLDVFQQPLISNANPTFEKIEVNKSNLSDLQNRFISFDIETTGLSPSADRIVELGAVLFVDGKPEKTFSSLVNPNMRISSAASAVNHITNEMLESAPSENEIYPKFIDFLGDAINGDIVICAHNATFDFGFLQNTFVRLDYNANIRYVDTLSLARKYVKGVENYKQSTLEKYFDITNSAEHRAASDAESCGKIFLKILDYVETTVNVDTPAVEKIDNALYEPLQNSRGNNFKIGLSYYEKGEFLRKCDFTTEAIEMFDKARSVGYHSPALYESYAKLYRKLKDYNSEIAIIHEGLPHIPDYKKAHFEARLERAQELLLSSPKLKNNQIDIEKAIDCEPLIRENKSSKGRKILQLNDDGTIINEYETISAASREVGISSKCIRDAANGIQKHAGGYCWKFCDCKINDNY